MSDENKLFSDYLLDRKFLKRKLSIWRNIALVLIAIFSINYISKKYSPSSIGSDYIATVELYGEIFDNDKRDKVLRSLAKNDKVKAVIIKIDSVGGDLYSSEKVYGLIKNISAKKPVVAVVESYAASGAYMAAMATNQIFAGNTSLVGSVGAISMTPDISELAKKIGIKVNVIKSGPLKAQPLPFEAITPEAKQHVQDLIDKSYKIFSSILLKERADAQHHLQKISSGAIFFGNESIELGLIDQIGDEENALDYLEKEKKISKSLPVKNISIKKTKKKLEALIDSFEDVQQSAHQLHLMISKLFNFSIN